MIWVLSAMVLLASGVYMSFKVTDSGHRGDDPLRDYEPEKSID